MHRGRILTALALAAFAPASASAAFAPRMGTTLDPAQAGAPTQVTLGIGQAPGETPAKRVTVKLPPGLAANGAPVPGPIGTVEAQTEGLGPIGGVMTLGGDGALTVPLSGQAGLLSQTLTARVVRRPNGVLDLTIDGLPPVPLTTLVFRFGTPGRALLRNPAACGPQVFESRLTSWSGEAAIAQSVAWVTGCPDPFELSSVRLAPKRFLAVRRGAHRTRQGYGTALTWHATRAVETTPVKVERLVRGRWKRFGSLEGSGAEGPNVMRFDGRMHNHALVPGAYRFIVLPQGTDARAVVPFRVLKPR
ncbi:MAG: hypothetical protein H0V29_06490 [Thermoleophilaceae bacterium]|nr:hypothetical protein [Thermoleophilaceae bacterium]